MPRALLAVVLGSLAACSGGSTPEPAPTDAPAARPSGTIHLLSFSRLQGYADGVICNPDEPAPLPAAGRVRAELAAQDPTVLACIGDTTVQAAAITRNRAARVGADARAGIVLDAMVEAGVDLFVPSHGDFFEGVNHFLDRAAARGLRVLASNLDVNGREDVLRSHVVEHPNGLKVAFLGVLPPDSLGKSAADTEPGVHVAKPKRRLRQVSSDLVERGEAHLVVLLSALPAQVNQGLCDLRDIHFIIGSSDPGFEADRLVPRHGTSMAYHKLAGRELAQTTFRIVEGDFAMLDLSQIHVLPDEIASQQAAFEEHVEQYGTDDPEEIARLVMPGLEDDFMRKYTLMLENIEWVAEHQDYDGSWVAHHTVPLEPAPEDDPVLAVLARQSEVMRRAVEDDVHKEAAELDPDSTHPLPASCEECHAEQYAFWAATDHARAYESLVAVDRALDSTCLFCHAAGYSKVGGFLDPRLGAPYGGVTCYNCHDAKTYHSEVRRTVTDPVFVRSDIEWMTQGCNGCHSGRRSPGFDLEEALPRVTCPPMRPDDPSIVRAYSAALRALERAREEGDVWPRDEYLEGRALLGLGRRDEAFEKIRSFARENTTHAGQAIEVADLLEEHGDSFAAVEVMREFLVHQPSDYDANLAYWDLLLHADDPDARDPGIVISHIDLVAPDDGGNPKSQELPIRVVQLEALHAAGRTEEGFELLQRVFASFPEDEGVREMVELYTGRPPPGR